MLSERRERDFWKKAKELGGVLKDWPSPVGLVYNHDADGLTSGAIGALMIKRMGKEFKSICLKQIYADEIPRIKALNCSHYLFIDFGSGQLDLLKENFDHFMVLDHHEPQPIDHDLHLNPLLHGIDGGSEVSAAGVAYAVARSMTGKNVDLSALAIVGALGDMQDSRTGKLEGFNAGLVQEAVEEGFLEVKNDLRLYGRISRPLTQFLTFSTSPVLPGLTGNEEACKRFLGWVGIELTDQNQQWRSYEDLSLDEKKRLTSALILHLNKFNTPEWKLQQLIGETYTLLDEGEKSPTRDGKEFATLLNAMGRHKFYETGLAVAMGDRGDAFSRAAAHLQQHREQLAKGIQLVNQPGRLQEFSHFYFFDAGSEIKDSIVGIVAGMIYGNGRLSESKPILGLSIVDAEFMKVSGRASTLLTRNGLHLGLLFREIATRLGNGAEGGGHAIAAGIKFSTLDRDAFLELVGPLIEHQLTIGIPTTH